MPNKPSACINSACPYNPSQLKCVPYVCLTGDSLGVCELMLGYRRLADLTADSMVQCLLVPADTFMRLVKTVPGVYTRAWQATAAQLAAQHHHILGEHRQLAPLNMFFRWVMRSQQSLCRRKGSCSSILCGHLPDGGFDFHGKAFGQAMQLIWFWYPS